MKKDNYDIFIAYHGTYEEGSSHQEACSLATFLINNGLKVFFYPFSKKDSYKTNIFQVIDSSTFVLIASNKIHRDSKGKIDYRKHYELSVELDSFYSSTFLDGKLHKSALDSKVVFCGKYDEEFRQGDESKLHPLFSDRVHYSIDQLDKEKSYKEIYDWVLSRLSAKIQKNSNYLTSRLSNEVQNVYSKRTAMITGERFNESILRAKKITCIGISNTDLTSRVDQDAVYECLENGGSVEIYFLDPNGKYTPIREQEEMFDDNRIKFTTNSNLRVALAFREMLPDELKNNYKLFLYDVSPRLNIIFIDDNLYLQFYGFISRGMDTPSFAIKRQEGKSPLYDYCQKSYNYVKNNAKEVDYNE